MTIATQSVPARVVVVPAAATCRDGSLEGARGRLERGDLPPPEAHAESVAARHAGHGASRRHPPGSSAPPRRVRCASASRAAKRGDAGAECAVESQAPVPLFQDARANGRRHPLSTPADRPTSPSRARSAFACAPRSLGAREKKTEPTKPTETDRRSKPRGSRSLATRTPDTSTTSARRSRSRSTAC